MKMSDTYLQLFARYWPVRVEASKWTLPTAMLPSRHSGLHRYFLEPGISRKLKANSVGPFSWIERKRSADSASRSVFISFPGLRAAGPGKQSPASRPPSHGTRRTRRIVAAA